MDLFSQVKFCPKCCVGIWVDVPLVIVESTDEFEVVSHETQFVWLERAFIMSLEHCNEQ